jgi:hypothetical protein
LDDVANSNARFPRVEELFHLDKRTGAMTEKENRLKERLQLSSSDAFKEAGCYL